MTEEESEGFMKYISKIGFKKFLKFIQETTIDGHWLEDSEDSEDSEDENENEDNDKNKNIKLNDETK